MRILHLFFFPLFFFLLLIFIFSSDLRAQSTPSVSGVVCSLVHFGNVWFGYGNDVATAQNATCFLANTTYDNGQCVFLSGARRTLTCTVAAVCLVGTGYIAADSGGFCPDPHDDDDGDGSNCDSGEEGTSDCICDDSSTISVGEICPEDDGDRDNDGIPDSDDDDDGVCDKQNSGDPDCDGVCNANDESGSDDCADGDCPVGDEEFFHPFDLSVFPFTPPSEVCSQSGCLYNERLECNNSVSNPNQHRCRFRSDGQSCTGCTEPSCSDSECPDGTSRDSISLDCEDIPNFCDFDEHTNGTQDGSPDGVPDNIDSFACGSDEPCDLDSDPNCSDPSNVVTYACSEQVPVCPNDASAVDCAILQQQYKLRCSANIEQDQTCEQPFKCELADPALCAIAHTNYLSFCRNFVPEEDQQALDNLINPTDSDVNDIVSGAFYYGDRQSPNSLIDLDQIDLQNNDFSLSGNYQDTYNSTLNLGGQITLDVSEANPLLDFLGILVVISSTIFGFKTVTRAHTS